MGIGYSVQNLDAETTAKALGRDIAVKPKFTVNVCRAIRGMRVAKAKVYLENVIALEQAVPFTIHKRNVKHKSSAGGPGAFPVGSAKAVLRVLKDAESNAEYKGLDPDDLVVWHTAAHRAAPIQGMMPRAHGRAGAWNKSTSHIEIVLKERKTRASEEEAEPATKKPLTQKERRVAAKQRAARGITRKSKPKEES
ncbi:MAG: 50S ribosomal protein L22 [Thermoplasmatota archaeon]